MQHLDSEVINRNSSKETRSLRSPLSSSSDVQALDSHANERPSSKESSQHGDSIEISSVHMRSRTPEPKESPSEQVLPISISNKVSQSDISDQKIDHNSIRDVNDETSSQELNQVDVSKFSSIQTTSAMSEPKESNLEPSTQFTIANIMSQSNTSIHSKEVPTSKDYPDDSLIEKVEVNLSPIPDDIAVPLSTSELTTQSSAVNTAIDTIATSKRVDYSPRENLTVDSMHDKESANVDENNETNNLDTTWYPPLAYTNPGATSCEAEKENSKESSPSTVVFNDDNILQQSNHKDSTVINAQESDDNELLRSTLQEKENDCNTISKMISEKVSIVISGQ